MSHSVVFAPEVSDQLEALFLYVAERSSPAIAERFTGHDRGQVYPVSNLAGNRVSKGT